MLIMLPDYLLLVEWVMETVSLTPQVTYQPFAFGKE